MFKVKAGIARVFKAPNLYQSSEGYLLSTRGNGCPNNVSEGSCYLLGNPDLDPEISVNKEIGLAFALEGYEAGINLGTFNDIEIGDIIETFEMQEIERK